MAKKPCLYRLSDRIVLGKHVGKTWRDIIDTDIAYITSWHYMMFEEEAMAYYRSRLSAPAPDKEQSIG